MQQPAYRDDDTMPLPRICDVATDAPAPSPVFVDSSGRRQRRVRRLGWLLVVPAAAYIVLLISSLFGGPTLQSPFLPSPRVPENTQSRPPVAEPGSPSPGAVRRTGAPDTSPRPSPSPSRAGVQPTTGGGPGTTSGPAPSASQGSSPAQGNGSGRSGKPTSPPGQGGKPTAHP
ncbi:hypothetical protein ACFCZ1_11585 [Streptomyces sp. NPDC056224]|uniref:hypothetical protein n=1 Tax=Streptomyces sp. NPDC056224 TaxID=3345750 RepID=UPI0035DD9864